MLAVMMHFLAEGCMMTQWRSVHYVTISSQEKPRNEHFGGRGWGLGVVGQFLDLEIFIYG